MKKKIISFFQYIFFLLVGFGLLYLVFRKLDLHEVGNEIANARYKWLLLSILLGLVSHIARAIRWNILIQSMGYQTKTKITFYAVMIGYLANGAFPRLGEVTRCGVLSKKTGVPFNALIGTVISERIFDLFVLGLIIFSVIFFQLDFLRSFIDGFFMSNMSGVMDTGTLVITIIISVAIIVLPLVLFWIFFRKIRELNIYKKISDFLVGLLDGIISIWRMKNKAAFIGLTVVIWFFYVLMTYAAFFALDATSELNFIDAITLMALGSLGIVAPVPGGIGAYQFIVKAVLVEIYMIASEPAASFSIIMWATQMVLIIVAGIISYYLLMMTRSIKQDTNEKSDVTGLTATVSD